MMFGMRGHGRMKKKVSQQSAEILRLTPDNAKFTTKNGFPSLTLKTETEEKIFSKVSLRRTFPFELLFEYISVLDEEDSEIGLIYNIDEFKEQSEILKTELLRRYYEPVIKTIISLKERYGFSYWKVELSDGRNVDFTMQDTFRNIIRAGEDKAILLDVDGNRFVIESITKLDKRSHKKIELYL